MLSVSLVRDGDGDPLYFVSQIEDITERKHAHQELERLAERRLADRAAQPSPFRRGAATGARNGSHGNPAGRPRCSCSTSTGSSSSTTRSATVRATTCSARWPRRLTHRLRETDVIARLGGDEFAALLIDLHDGR